MNYSITWVSAIVLCLAWLFRGAGIDFDETKATEAIAFLVQVASVVGVFYGRWKQGDIKNVFGKKV